ncbi:hypothetical protein T06_104, partial [Trichinella sp. T6]
LLHNNKQQEHQQYYALSIYNISPQKNYMLGMHCQTTNESKDSTFSKGEHICCNTFVDVF